MQTMRFIYAIYTSGMKPKKKKKSESRKKKLRELAANAVLLR